MKLSELINYQNLLAAMTAQQVKKDSDAEIEKITYLVESHHVQIDDLAQRLQQRRENIGQSYDDFEKDLQELKKQLQQMIASAEKPWFTESYRLYEEEMRHASAEYILDRRPAITAETQQFYQDRIRLYNSWKFPAMIIRPGRESFIQELLATDPLYLVDESYDLLDPAMALFPEVYQQRLRPYVVNEFDGTDILYKLPQGQFGLVFAYNFFNFKPFEVLKQYLSEIFQKLRQGGTLVMTFNDCDNTNAVRLVENHFCCYTPGYLVKDLAQSLGYEILLEWSDKGPSTWIELRKPGVHVSLKGGQALAKVIPNTVAESK